MLHSSGYSNVGYKKRESDGGGRGEREWRDKRKVTLLPLNDRRRSMRNSLRDVCKPLFDAFVLKGVPSTRIADVIMFP